jgi:hypothetical protein
MGDRPRYRNGILVYTAMDIHDDVRDGMDPDCLFVGLAKFEALSADRDEWRCAVIDAAVVNWTYTKEDEDNPYLAVCKMVACAARESLDPLISVEAKKLHDRIAELTADRDSETRWACQYKDERDELQRRLDAVDAERENDWRRTL